MFSDLNTNVKTSRNINNFKKNNTKKLLFYTADTQKSFESSPKIVRNNNRASKINLKFSGNDSKPYKIKPKIAANVNNLKSFSDNNITLANNKSRNKSTNIKNITSFSNDVPINSSYIANYIRRKSENSIGKKLSKPNSARLTKVNNVKYNNIIANNCNRLNLFARYSSRNSSKNFKNFSKNSSKLTINTSKTVFAENMHKVRSTKNSKVKNYPFRKEKSFQRFSTNITNNNIYIKQIITDTVNKKKESKLLSDDFLQKLNYTILNFPEYRVSHNYKLRQIQLKIHRLFSKKNQLSLKNILDDDSNNFTTPHFQKESDNSFATFKCSSNKKEENSSLVKEKINCKNKLCEHVCEAPSFFT